MASPIGPYSYDLPTEVDNYELLRRMASHFLTNQHILTMVKEIALGEQEIPSFHSFVSSHYGIFYALNSDETSVLLFLENFKRKIEKETVKDIKVAETRLTESQQVALNLLTEVFCFFYLDQAKNLPSLKPLVKGQFFYYIKTTDLSSIDLEELKTLTGLLEKANLQKIQ